MHMKKLLLLFAVPLFCFSCDKNDGDDGKYKTTVVVASVAGTRASWDSGYHDALIVKFKGDAEWSTIPFNLIEGFSGYEEGYEYVLRIWFEKETGWQDDHPPFNLAYIDTVSKTKKDSAGIPEYMIKNKE